MEQVTLDYRQPGQTTITNSLHQQTIYRHAIVGGEFRPLEVRGPGCASCGDTNVKYGYDKLGRLVETTRLDEQGRPLLTIKTELDPYGRPLKVGRIAYRNGHAQPVQWRLRYEYDRAHWKPVLIARPSVVPGREVATRMTYNGQEQPLSIVETGFTPAWGGQSAAASMARALHYRYNHLNLRVETDGPLPNAQRNPGPENSDIARTDYNPDTKLPVRTVAPGKVITEVLERDAALRPARVRTTDGAAEQVATIRHNWRGQPESITIEAVRLVTGKDGQRRADPAGKLARTLRYQYDANGRLTGITQPGNLTARFEYDAA